MANECVRRWACYIGLYLIRYGQANGVSVYVYWSFDTARLVLHGLLKLTPLICQRLILSRHVDNILTLPTSTEGVYEKWDKIPLRQTTQTSLFNLNTMYWIHGRKCHLLCVIAQTADTELTADSYHNFVVRRFSSWPISLFVYPVWQCRNVTVYRFHIIICY